MELDWTTHKTGLTALCTELETGEMASTRHFEAPAQHPEAAVGEPARTLGRQIDNMEFEEALATLERIHNIQSGAAHHPMTESPSLAII